MKVLLSSLIIAGLALTSASSFAQLNTFDKGYSNTVFADAPADADSDADKKKKKKKEDCE